MESTKTAIISGGCSGIGLAVTKKLIANNIKSIIIGRDAEKLNQAKQVLGKLCFPVDGGNSIGF